MWGINNLYTNEWWRDDEWRILKFATEAEAEDYVAHGPHDIEFDEDEATVKLLTPEDYTDPNIAFFSTYMHVTGGGVVCVGDWPSLAQAQEHTDSIQQVIDRHTTKKD